MTAQEAATKFKVSVSTVIVAGCWGLTVWLWARRNRHVEQYRIARESVDLVKTDFS